MMEVWAVIGRVCLNLVFHRELFDASEVSDVLEDLVVFRRILRRDNHLNLSRSEIMLIHRILQERHPDINLPPMQVESAEGDLQIVPIREGWTAPPPTFPDDFQLCAIVGLACMDFSFRTNLHQNSRPVPEDTEALRAFLFTPTGDSPIFSISEPQLVNLNVFLRSASDQMIQRLREFHRLAWVQPERYPCNGGYTDTVGTNFVFFSQAGLIRFIEKNPSQREEMLGEGAIFGPLPA